MRPKASADKMKKNCPVHALGALSPSEASALDAHIQEGCPECEAELESFEAVARRLALAAGEQGPSENARARVVALMRGLPGQVPIRDASATRTLEAETATVSLRLHEGEWKEVSPGLFHKHLFADEARGTVTSLFRLLPGTEVPEHHHNGVEECIVLEGDFRVNGEVYGPGDYRCMTRGSADQDMSTRGGSLLMIVSAGGCGGEH